MKIKGLLIDLDGTVYDKGNLIPGIKETIQWIHNRNIPFKFCTNATRKTTKEIQNKLIDMGITIEISNIISAPQAAIEYCRFKSYKSIEVFVQEEKMLNEFKEFIIDNNEPEAIILGDIGPGFTYALLTKIFKKLKAGSDLIAMHKNRFWITKGGLSLDLGPFVSALEYATDKSAIIVGKPNQEFFKMAIKDWNISPENIMMIGDDIEIDIKGAQDCNIKGGLVKTGKYDKLKVKSTRIKPDYILSSLADLKNLFNDN